MTIRKIATALISLGTLLAASSATLAQSSVPIQIIVPYAPGGSADIIGRLIGDQLGKNLNRSVVIINQPGAGGELGSVNASKAKPDGNTLLFQAPAVTIVQTLRKNPTFDVRRDLVPITLAAESAMGFYINPDIPARDIREFVAHLKANPGKLNYASAGIGSSAHLYTELFKIMAGVDMVHVPYTGGSGGPTAVAKNDVQLLIADSLGSPRPVAASGKVRMLAVGSLKRSAVFPDIPTVDESGVPGYEVSYWVGFFAPAGTPAEIAEKLNATLTEIIKSPAIKDRLSTQGYSVVANSTADFRKYVDNEVNKWEGVVRDAKIPKE